MELILYALYLFLAVFSAGNMFTLQIQHYGIYSFVGKDHFKDYIKANNKSAMLPSVLPAMLLLMTNLILLFIRPGFMSGTEAIISFSLNIIALVSTFAWQRKIQGEMAITGYDESKIRLLIVTNRIRVIAFLAQAIMAVSITMIALNK